MVFIRESERASANGQLRYVPYFVIRQGHLH
jgi:hypothetical protein